MTTANKTEIEATISSEAMRLLDCFDDQFSDIILHLAERTAIKRGSSKDHVEIAAADVKDAADLLVKIIRDSNEFPNEMLPVVESMRTCAEDKLGLLE